METSSTVAPSDSNISADLLTDSLTSSSMPSPMNSFGSAIFIPLRSRSMPSRNSASTPGILVESLPWLPEMISKIFALALRLRVIGPIWSNEDANATRPYIETPPYLGFMPPPPQNPAGRRTEPPVSEPSENGTYPAATAAAGPPDDPPGTAFVSQGLRAGLK